MNLCWNSTKLRIIFFFRSLLLFPTISTRVHARLVSPIRAREEGKDGAQVGRGKLSSIDVREGRKKGNEGEFVSEREKIENRLFFPPLTSPFPPSLYSLSHTHPPTHRNRAQVSRQSDWWSSLASSPP